MRQYTKLPSERERSHYDMVNGRGVEQEVGALLYGIVRMVKPKVCIETGTLVGDSAEWIGKALRDNNCFPGISQICGHLVTCDIDPERIEPARQRMLHLPVSVKQSRGIDVIASFEKIDFAHIDSGSFEVRKEELMSLGDHNVAPGGVVCWHDALHAEHMYDAFSSKHDWPHLIFPSVVGFAVFMRPE